MKTIAIILLCLPLTVFAREVIIDPYQLERHESKGAEDDRCDKVDTSKDFFADLACSEEVAEKYKKEYPGRGTDEYAKKVYSGLTEEEARVKIGELEALQLKARSRRVAKEDIQPGEVHSEAFLVEYMWIYESVLGIDPARIYYSPRAR